MIQEDELYKIGFFARPHGVKGEIALITDYDIAGISGDPCIVCNIDDIWTPFFIISCRQKNVSITLVTFDNLDSAEKVKFLSGKTACIPTQNAPMEESEEDTISSFDGGEGNALKAGKWHDLIGYTILDERHGILGHVSEVDDRTLNTLLIIDYRGNEVLIPLALATSILHKQRTINMSLPDGFLDIYI